MEDLIEVLDRTKSVLNKLPDDRSGFGKGSREGCDMFKQTVVKDCPITRGSRGVVRIEPRVLAELAGALEDERGMEWAVWLHGSKSEDGLEVAVTEISVPPQERTSGDVDVADGDGEVKQPRDCMGVLHSHHEMGAWMSGTDVTKLNPRYALSIVISSNIVDDESAWLGFSYKAEGKVKLPCGGSGLVGFYIQPLGVEDWPLAHRARLDAEGSDDLGDCGRVESAPATDYKELVFGACGLTAGSKVAMRAVLGVAHGLTKVLPAPDKVKVLGSSQSHNEPLKRQWIDGYLMEGGKRQGLLWEPRDQIAEIGVGICEICAQVTEVRVMDGVLVCRECKKELVEEERWQGGARR